MKLIADEPATAQEPESPDDTHIRLIRWVEDAESEGAPGRENSEKCRDYYDGRQITPAEAAELKSRHQPVIAFNMIQAKVDYLLGLEKQQRSDPKAFPRTPQAQDAAEAATDALRYVADDSDLPQRRSQGWEYMVVEGACGYDVGAEAGPDGALNPVVHTVHWDRMIWDPHSRERDFSDARWLGVINWMDRDDVLARWPGAEDVLEAAMNFATNGDTFEDRPRWNVWSDEKRGRVRVVQMYWRDGGAWQFGTFTRGGWLDDAQPSPYVDEDGQPECPLVFQSAYVDRENRRYGAVQMMLDPQDEINVHHRKLVHAMSVRQIIAEQGAVADVDAARREMAKPDGFIEKAPGMQFEIVPTTDISAGQSALLQQAMSVLQVQGPNAAMMGKQGKEASGRAIALSQQGGALEIGSLLDLHRHAQRRVCRAIWNRIKQYWTAEKWVRVTDDERNVRFAGLNVPAQVGVDPMTGVPIVEVQNDVSRMNVDIIIEEGPDIATLAIEQFQTLAELAKGGLPINPKYLIQAAPNLRNREEILKDMEQQGAAPNPQMLELQRKAKKDERDFALGVANFELDAAIAGASAESDMIAAQQPQQQAAPVF